MSDSIHIGKVLVPTVDYAVGASAVLGIRDSGKTVTSKGIAEQLLDQSVPIVVFDAVGKWRWMKVAAESSCGKAYKVVVAGGREPDLPLTPHSVPEIVRAALKERIPLVIDLFSKTMSKADWRRIVQTAIHIIHFENEGGAVHVFLEEAAEFVPQKIYDGETYAEVEKLVRMGGNASVGITLINQRSQEVNKAVLDNCSTALVLGCQVGKNAIEAVEKWIDRLDPATSAEVTTSLPKLQSGEAWVWTRKSLDKPSLEKMPMCRSFHPDRRTPEFVLKSVKPTDTAEFVSKLSSMIPKVIEEAKANDPAELKRTIANLKREMAKGESKVVAPPATVEMPILDDAAKNLLSKVCQACDAVIQESETRREHFLELSKQVNSLRASVGVIVSNADKVALARTKPALFREVKRILHAPTGNGHSSEISGGLRRMMIALAQRPNLTKKQLGVRAGLSSKSGTFGTYLGRLRSSGWIDGSNELQITPKGLDALGRYDPLPEGQELLRYWLQDLGQSGAGRMLSVLAEVYPKALTKEELGERADISHSSGTFGTYLGRLRSLELIEGRGELRATAELFE